MARSREPSDLTSRWEWLAGGVSLLIVLVLIAVLVHGALRTAVPARVTVHLDTIVSAPPGHLVRFSVHNPGTETAAAVFIEGTLGSDEAPLERSTVTFDYLPGGGRREGTLYFRHDPHSSPLRLRATGYREP